MKPLSSLKRRAKVTSSIYNNWYALWHGCATDARYICVRVRSRCSDSDRLRLGSYTSVANIDVGASL